MFEKASRMKLRFDYNGMWSVEDLWDMQLEWLDKIYKSLNVQIRRQQEDSLLEAKTSVSEVLELKIAIVKRVVEVRLAERKAKEDQAKNVAMRQKLLAIKAERQEEGLKGLSDEELDKMIDELKVADGL